MILYGAGSSLFEADFIDIYPAIRRFALLFERRHDAAQDLAHEALERLWVRGSKADLRVDTTLLTYARGVVVKCYRQRAGHQLPESLDELLATGHELVGDHPDRWSVEMWSLVRWLARKMHTDHLRVYLLRSVYFYTQSEIAEDLRRDRGTVKKYLEEAEAFLEENRDRIRFYLGGQAE